MLLRKKSDKWRLLQDLRAINATIEDMRALQPGLPSPIAVPEGYNIIVIDLQDCFFTIPLNAGDKKQFAFSLPSKNLIQPYLQFQWKVLPQVMKNSPAQLHTDGECQQMYIEIYTNILSTKA